MAKKKSQKKPARKTPARAGKAVAAKPKPKPKAAASAKPRQAAKAPAATVKSKSAGKTKAAAKPAPAARETKPAAKAAPASKQTAPASRPAATSAGVGNGRSAGNGHARAIQSEPILRDIPLSDDDLRKINPLKPDEVEYFRELLLEKRAEIIGSVKGMQEARDSGGGEVSRVPFHPADVGSDHFEQELNLGLMESERRLLYEIDDALDRIRKGTYGVCVEAGKPIPKARLEIKPWAKYCIEVAMEREKRGLR